LITLKEINKENWFDVIKLYSAEDMKNKIFESNIASNCFSLAQASIDKNWITKAIYHGELLVGFTMYGYSEELSGYELCRIMIHYNQQGKGYGKKALLLILEEMTKLYQCEEILITFLPDNSKAKNLYESIGFKDTGRVIKGLDDELVYSYETKLVNH
jgi:diamine N-acetyltransferase